jgi:hypothetical protein
VVATAGFLLVAMLKPWSFGQPTPDGATGPGHRPGGLVASPDVTPVPTASPDPNGIACFAADKEQVVLLERWPGNEVRSWIAATDISAADPLDPRITRVEVYSSHLIGLGVCAPRALGGGSAAGAWIHDVRRIGQIKGSPVLENPGLVPDPITTSTGDPDAAVLYGPVFGRPNLVEPLLPGTSPGDLPPSSTAPSGPPAPATWSYGSYVIEFTFPMDSTQQLRWLRIDVLPPAAGQR